jgi:hypothetical protein
MRRAGWTAIVALPMFALGCAPGGPAREIGPADRPLASGCAREAERLERATPVYAAPEAQARPFVTLDTGRFVYRCTRRGAWLGVMFPAAGEPVDCSARAAGNPCPLGWVRGDLETTVLG